MKEVFCGIQLDDKPTGVPDGSEFIEVDTKDIYVFYKGTWYKQKDKVLDKLEDKEVTITENTVTNLTPTEGKIGFNKVKVTTNVQSGADLTEYFSNTVNNVTTQSQICSGTLGLIKKFPEPITINSTNITRLFRGFWGLIEVPTLLSQTNFITMDNTFENCSGLKEIPIFADTSHVTSMNKTFNYCSNLETVNLLDTSSVTIFENCFNHCESLKNVPIFDLSSATNLTGMFNICSALTDTAIDNIYQSLINASSYTGTKTLATIGFNSSDQPASRLETIPHYADLVSAGWSIGY